MTKEPKPRRTPAPDQHRESELLSLRKASPQDVAFLLELYVSTRWSELESVPWDDEQKQAFFKMQFDLRERQYEISYPAADHSLILYRDKPIGRMLVDRSGPDLVLVDIALMPERRNAGIGTGLIASLLNEAADQGKRVRLQVLSISPAVKLYERLGFLVEAEGGVYLSMVWEADAQGSHGLEAN